MTIPNGCSQCGKTPTTDVVWYLFKRCGTSERLLEKRDTVKLIKHLHTCNRHGHTHLCKNCYTAYENDIITLPITEDNLLIPDKTIAHG